MDSADKANTANKKLVQGKENLSPGLTSVLQKVTDPNQASDAQYYHEPLNADLGGFIMCVYVGEFISE